MVTAGTSSAKPRTDGRLAMRPTPFCLRCCHARRGTRQFQSNNLSTLDTRAENAPIFIANKGARRCAGGQLLKKNLNCAGPAPPAAAFPSRAVRRRPDACCRPVWRIVHSCRSENRETHGLRRLAPDWTAAPGQPQAAYRQPSQQRPSRRPGLPQSAWMVPASPCARGWRVSAPDGRQLALRPPWLKVKAPTSAQQGWQARRRQPWLAGPHQLAPQSPAPAGRTGP